MLITNVNGSDIDKAMVKLNTMFKGNIIIRDFKWLTVDRCRMTLTVKDSKGPGHRLGFPAFKGFSNPPDMTKRRRLKCACWHVHGHFFDILIGIRPEVRIKSGGSLANPDRGGGWITAYGGNWQDWNIGSDRWPYYFSEACECNDIER